MSDPIVQKLDEMQARCEATPDGQWFVTRDGKQLAIGSWDGITHRGLLYTDLSNPSPNEMAWFIVHARTDMPKLIAALKAVLEEHYPIGEESDCRCCPQECACGVWEYQCVTVKVLTKALGVDDA